MQDRVLQPACLLRGEAGHVHRAEAVQALAVNKRPADAFHHLRPKLHAETAAPRPIDRSSDRALAVGDAPAAVDRVLQVNGSLLPEAGVAGNG